MIRSVSPGRSVSVMVMAAACGCVTTHAVRRPVSANDIRVINDAGRGAPPLYVEYLPAAGSGDAVAWKPVLSLQAVDRADVATVGTNGERLTLEGARVKSVRVVEPGWGALQGLAVGATSGGLFGLVLGATDNSGGIIFSHDEAIIFGGILFGALGGLVGALIGGQIGRQTVFVFDDQGPT